MEFLMQAFLRKLEDYKKWLTFTYAQDPITGSYIFTFKDLPPKVDVDILKRRISVQTGIDEKGKAIMEDQCIGKPLEEGSRRYIEVTFDEDTYAVKMNNLEVVFRDYAESKI